MFSNAFGRGVMALVFASITLSLFYEIVFCFFGDRFCLTRLENYWSSYYLSLRVMFIALSLLGTHEVLACTLFSFFVWSC